MGYQDAYLVQERLTRKMFGTRPVRGLSFKMVLPNRLRNFQNAWYFEGAPEVPADAKVAHEETFGPLVPLFRFETDEEALRLVDDTEFELASYFYHRDVGRVWRVVEGLESGMVGINAGMISTEIAPFGGVKESGRRREGSHYRMDEFVEFKYPCFGGIEAPTSPRPPSPDRPAGQS